MKMSFLWKIVPVAAFAAFALVACDSGSSSDSDAAESSSSAAVQSSGSSSSGMESSGSVAESSSGVTASSSSIAVRSSSGVSSSSSAAPSSSSVAKSSSSKANWAYLNPAISYGEFTDDRDGHAYKYVKIGTQTWMAQNLNYADSAAMPDLKENSWCYNDGADSCAKYGRLYTWTAAMNIASSYLMILAGAVISTPQQGVCPAGWHLPTSGEWAMLATAVGGSDSAGTKLKSTSGWGRWYSDGSGTDDYGFSALPAGNREIAGGFYDAGANAHFWNATEYDSSKAYYMVDMVGTNYYDKRNAFSVRCVQD